MNTAWEDAIGSGDIRMVREILHKGIDVNSRNSHGQTALMLAAHAGHLEVVEALIGHKANLNITGKFGLSALMLALVSGYEDIARVLAKAGADLSLLGTGAPGFTGKTAYDLAVARGMIDVLEELRPKPAGGKR
ncbi:MAG: ankyrin repeat domain-containing protein [Desulforhopalus sp.]|nr:ankyrin repeat domain-containing protein [Desulforhopalus sp.]